MRHIDEVDQRILRALLRDASVSQESIAHEVGTSVGTVSNRIKRMKEEGIITKFVPAVNARALGFDIVALIDIRIAGGHMEEVQQAFCDHPNVCSIYDITGEYDSMFVAKFCSTNDMNAFIKLLAKHKHVQRTSTKLVLNIVKESMAPDI